MSFQPIQRDVSQMFAWSEGKTNPTRLERWLFAWSTWQYRISLQQINCSWPSQL